MLLNRRRRRRVIIKGFFGQALKGLKVYFQRIKKYPLAIALAFSLILTVGEAYLFEQNYLAFFRRFSFRSWTDVRDLLYFLGAGGALVFFVRSMLVSRFGWKCVYFGIFALALSVEYGFHGALGRFTLPSDLENTFYASDASDKFGAVTLFFSWLIVVPLIAFRLLFIFAGEQAAAGARLLAVNVLILFGVFLLFADFYRPPLPTSAFAAHFDNLSNSALYFGELKLTRRKRMNVEKIPDAAAMPRNNIVFIVDESVRADHLSLNGYARRTTPTLDALEKQNLLRNFGEGVSGATESVTANRLLLTGLSHLPDRKGEIHTLPTIFQYARAAGYRTFYFDGQDYAEWIGSREDRADFGKILTAEDFPGVEPYDLDRAFAAKIREITTTSKGNFIWVNKRGVHFRYEKNYPAYQTVWTPTDLTADTAELRTNQPLENNYDNAILYNSETFFKTLAGDALPPEAVILYSADHGQTLIQDRATHAGDAKTEALVPILIIGKDARLESLDTRYKASHRNLFASLLDLMNYPKEMRKHNYAPSLFEARATDSTPRSFFVGNPSGAFGGRKVVFDAAEK